MPYLHTQRVSDHLFGKQVEEMLFLIALPFSGDAGSNRLRPNRRRRGGGRPRGTQSRNLKFEALLDVSADVRDINCCPLRSGRASSCDKAGDLRGAFVTAACFRPRPQTLRDRNTWSKITRCAGVSTFRRYSSAIVTATPREARFPVYSQERP